MTDRAGLAGYLGVRGGCVLVPTMGALHAGHGSLIRRGAEEASRRGLGGGCVVSVFVNPTQFDDPSDYARYPKTLGADEALAREAGASAVWAPGVEEVYPPGEEVGVPELPAEATGPGLEDARRPGHFAGVCRVVKRLFEVVGPAAAVFGEKDYQQLRVVASMVRGLGMGVEVIAGATVREADGLAMSSRNRFLKAEERGRAGALWRALVRARGEGTVSGAERVMREEVEGAGLLVEYAVVRDAAGLMPMSGGRGRGFGRALIAARLGSVRLIDNAAW